MEAAAASGSRGSSHQDSNSFLGAYRRPQQHQAAKCMGVCARCAGGRVHGCAGCPVVCCRLQPRGRQMGLRLADSLGVLTWAQVVSSAKVDVSLDEDC
eukprot:scaffold227980_cov20-Tisochrysis_lutea.AAC.4